MLKNILQYQISDWHQAVRCKSNLSPYLSIHVSDFMQNDDITGTRISIEHAAYGTVFAAMNFPEGNLVNEEIPRSLSRDTVLNELSIYGFYITFIEEFSISNSIVDILQNIRNLKFDKIRLIVVHEDSKPEIQENYIVAFNIDKVPGWINTNYSPSRSEWDKAILDGNALNISNYAKEGQDWSWIYNGLYDIENLIERHSSIYE